MQAGVVDDHVEPAEALERVAHARPSTWASCETSQTQAEHRRARRPAAPGGAACGERLRVQVDQDQLRALGRRAAAPWPGRCPLAPPVTMATLSVEPSLHGTLLTVALCGAAVPGSAGTWRACCWRRRAQVSSCCAGQHDRHLQADALGRQHLAPVGDELLVGLAHGPDVAVEVVQAERIHPAVVLAQRGVPVHLVGQRIPGEADDRARRRCARAARWPTPSTASSPPRRRSGPAPGWSRCASPAAGSGRSTAG